MSYETPPSPEKLVADVKHSKIWAPVVLICFVTFVGGIFGMSTIENVRGTQRDEAVKVAAAENGCSYNNNVLTCPMEGR